MDGQRRHQTVVRANVDGRESIWTVIRLELGSLDGLK